MKSHTLAVLTLSVVCSSCTVWMHTQTRPHPDAMLAFDAEHADKDATLVALGSPQSRGIHRASGTDRELWFYSAMEGNVNLFTMGGPADTVTAFVTFEHEKVHEFLAFASKYDGPVYWRGRAFSVKAAMGSIRVGETSVSSILDSLGEPQSRGRRICPAEGIAHDLLFYDYSGTGGDALTERWFILGYGSDGIVRDLLWVSSYQDDLDELSKLAPQPLRHLTQLDMDFPFVFSRTDAVATAAIDAGQVDALLRSNPENVDRIVEVLGPPTARGFKSFDGSEPLLLSHWSALVTEMQGYESAPPPRQDAARPDVLVNYAVVDFQQTRLFVGHTPGGDVREVYWVHPSGGFRAD